MAFPLGSWARIKYTVIRSNKKLMKQIKDNATPIEKKKTNTK